MKYIKKPIPVEAIRLCDNYEDILDWYEENKWFFKNHHKEVFLFHL